MTTFTMPASSSGILETIRVTRRPYAGAPGRIIRAHTIFDVDWRLPTGSRVGVRTRVYDDELSGAAWHPRRCVRPLFAAAGPWRRIILCADIFAQEIPNIPADRIAWVYVMQDDEPDGEINAWLGLPDNPQVYPLPIIDCPPGP